MANFRTNRVLPWRVSFNIQLYKR